jgi:hypothetical protein
MEQAEPACFLCRSEMSVFSASLGKERGHETTRSYSIVVWNIIMVTFRHNAMSEQHCFETVGKLNCHIDFGHSRPQSNTCVYPHYTRLTVRWPFCSCRWIWSLHYGSRVWIHNEIQPCQKETICTDLLRDISRKAFGCGNVNSIQMSQNVNKN